MGTGQHEMERHQLRRLLQKPRTGTKQTPITVRRTKTPRQRCARKKHRIQRVARRTSELHRDSRRREKVRSRVQRVQKCVTDFLNLVSFEVFGVKFSVKKSIFQNCVSGSPYGLFYRTVLKNQFFGRKFHSKTLKMTKFRRAGPNLFLNAL